MASIPQDAPYSGPLHAPRIQRPQLTVAANTTTFDQILQATPVSSAPVAPPRQEVREAPRDNEPTERPAPPRSEPARSEPVESRDETPSSRPPTTEEKPRDSEQPASEATAADSSEEATEAAAEAAVIAAAAVIHPTPQAQLDPQLAETETADAAEIDAADSEENLADQEQIGGRLLEIQPDEDGLPAANRAQTAEARERTPEATAEGRSSEGEIEVLQAESTGEATERPRDDSPRRTERSTSPRTTPAESEALAQAAAESSQATPTTESGEDPRQAVHRPTPPIARTGEVADRPTATPESAPNAATTPAPVGPAARVQPQLVGRARNEASTTTRVEVDPARFLTRVSRAFAAAGQRGGPIRLRLHPPELGALRLEIKLDAGAMTAHIEAETASAQAALLENLPALRDRLAEQGIRIEQFDVDLRDRQEPAEDRDNQQQRRPRSDRQGNRSPDDFTPGEGDTAIGSVNPFDAPQRIDVTI